MKKKNVKNSIWNLPNKITLLRIILSFVVVIILILPFDMMGINIPKLFINERIVIDVKYMVAGVLFIIASLTDFLDGYIASIILPKSVTRFLLLAIYPSKKSVREAKEK